MQRITASELIEAYDVFLIDAFGVLLDESSTFLHSQSFLSEIIRRGKQFRIITNGAAQNTQKTALNYFKKGLVVDPALIINSGGLLSSYREQNVGISPIAYIVGDHNAKELAEECGFQCLSETQIDQANTIIVMDEGNVELSPCVARVISTLYRKLDRRIPVSLLCPNPDYLYPKSKDNFGITAGCVAHMIEGALQLRYGTQAPSFVRLGKPNHFIYDVAKKSFADDARIVALGDQLQTDILGANENNIASCLLLTGMGNEQQIQNSCIKPKYLMSDLALR